MEIQIAQAVASIVVHGILRARVMDIVQGVLHQKEGVANLQVQNAIQIIVMLMGNVA